MRRRNPYVLIPVILICLVAPAQSDEVQGDITFPRENAVLGGKTPLAVFPHWKHRMYFTCTVCHDTLFKMQAGADRITMDAIRDGKFCAVCHNGKTAFEVGFDTCELCHRADTSGTP